MWIHDLNEQNLNKKIAKYKTKKAQSECADNKIMNNSLRRLAEQIERYAES